MQTLWFFFRCSTCSTDHNKSIVISSIGRSVTLDIEFEVKTFDSNLRSKLLTQKPPFPNIWMKETKAQYARDDPAFLVLLSAVLIVTSAGFSFTLGEPSYFSECLGNYWFSNTFRYSLLGLCQVPALRDICWYGEILLLGTFVSSSLYKIVQMTIHMSFWLLMIICPGGSGLGSRHSALVGQQHLPPQACSQGSGYIIDHPGMRFSSTLICS